MNAMETIQKLADSASKAIWGEHEEPVSGKMGNVATGEPYDAGNIEHNEDTASCAEGYYTAKSRAEAPPSTSTPRSTFDKLAIPSQMKKADEPIPMPKPELEAATKPRFVEAKPETPTTSSTPLKLTAEPTSMPKPEPDTAHKPRFVQAKPTGTDADTEPLHERGQSQPSNPAGPAKFAPSAISMHNDSTQAQSDTRPPRSSDQAAQSEPEALAKPQFMEAKPAGTHTDSELLHERTPAQPSSPAGPAKFAPSAISMHEDSTKAQSDTRPPRPSDKFESHTDPATSFAPAGITGVSGTGSAKYDEPASAAGITSLKDETSSTPSSSIDIASGTATRGDNPAISRITDTGEERTSSPSLAKPNTIDPNTIDSNTIDPNTIDTTATPPSSIGIASGTSTRDENPTTDKKDETTSTRSLTSPSTTDTPSSTADRPATQQKTSTTSATRKPTDGDADHPIKLTGPGPRPLEDLAREHGGDAGALSPETARGQGVKGGLLGDEEGVSGGGGHAAAAAAAAPAGGVETDRRDSAKSLGGEKGGSGEEYIKSSGLAADGGDFDASRAGAGREADRLLEAKGVHVTKGIPKGPQLDEHTGHGLHSIHVPHISHGSGHSSDHSSGQGSGQGSGHVASPGSGNGAEAGGKEKVGLKDKIKAKLHKSSASA